MLFRTGAKGFAAHVPRDATPIFFPEKENGRCDRPKERRFPLQASSSKSCNACRLHYPARGGAALALQDDLPLLLSSSAALPIL